MRNLKGTDNGHEVIHLSPDGVEFLQAGGDAITCPVPRSTDFTGIAGSFPG